MVKESMMIEEVTGDMTTSKATIKHEISLSSLYRLTRRFSAVSVHTRRLLLESPRNPSSTSLSRMGIPAIFH